MKVEVNRNAKSRRPSNRRAWKYWHPANLFRFPIPEDMTYEDEPIKFEICLK